MSTKLPDNVSELMPLIKDVAREFDEVSLELQRNMERGDAVKAKYEMLKRHFVKLSAKDGVPIEELMSELNASREEILQYLSDKPS